MVSRVFVLVTYVILIVSWENIVTAFAHVKDLLKEVPGNAEAPV